MEILYDYLSYESPKIGLFKIHTGEWNNGWLNNLVEYRIIGETEQEFIYKLLETGHGEWVGKEIIYHAYILPIGIHKTRLEYWINCQLSLFT